MGLRVFIGSSREARDGEVVPLFLTRMEEELKKRGASDSDVELKLWSNRVDYAKVAFTEVMAQLDDSDAGIFFFTKDESIESRGEKLVAPRDNVVLEVGMWAARFGIGRTFIFHDKLAKLPSNFEGLRFFALNTENTALLTTTLTSHCKQLAATLLSLQPKRPAQRQQLLDRFALGKTIADAQVDLAKIENGLVESARSAKLNAPIRLGTDTCLSSYNEGLGRVQETFLTTTFFDSGFWRSRNVDVLGVNKEMLGRIHANKGDARRIFLLECPWSEYLKRESDAFTLMRRNNDAVGIEKKKEMVERISLTIDELEAARCQVRFVFDERDARYKKLSEEMSLTTSARETEIAILDDFRIDLYRAGEAPHISSLIIYPSSHKNFTRYSQSAREYFDTLWELGGKKSRAAELTAAWRRELERWIWRVDYDSNWIAEYEWALDRSDREVKIGEMSAATRVLDHLRLMGKVNSYLDIGTCTARYPISLCRAGLFAPNASILALDDDDDCIRFSRGKISNLDPPLGDQVIEVEKGDFTDDPQIIRGRTFDLITCMLGTISHFGGVGHSPSKEDKADRLLRSLKRMHSFLNEDGILLIGNWSEFARSQNRLLAIYRQEDARVLSAWTPTRDELTNAAAKAGLSLVDSVVKAHDRLDVFVFRREFRKTRKRRPAQSQ